MLDRASVGGRAGREGVRYIGRDPSADRGWLQEDSSSVNFIVQNSLWLCPAGARLILFPLRCCTGPLLVILDKTRSNPARRQRSVPPRKVLRACRSPQPARGQGLAGIMRSGGGGVARNRKPRKCTPVRTFFPVWAARRRPHRISLTGIIFAWA